LKEWVKNSIDERTAMRKLKTIIREIFLYFFRSIEERAYSRIFT